jgi:predicted  nucleic acid-binding Zn-ribbon protein
MTELHEQISALITMHTRDLEEIERTLTDGYAHVLQLEAEKFRLEKRIGEVAQALHGGDTGEKVREISTLAKRVDVSIGNLTELRSLLADLRRHADTVRLEVELAASR